VPVSAAFFAGKLDCSKLDFLSRLFVQVIIGAQSGDYRNWDAIRAWAAGLHSTLVKA
jgi:menaquinone-dependent protoporphyrinogen IX oxidase